MNVHRFLEMDENSVNNKVIFFLQFFSIVAYFSAYFSSLRKFCPFLEYFAFFLTVYLSLYGSKSNTIL
jgi:hypothetical protein